MKKLMLVVMVLSLASMAMAMIAEPVDPGPAPDRSLPKPTSNGSNRLYLPNSVDYLPGTSDDTLNYIVSANTAYESWGRVYNTPVGSGYSIAPAGTLTDITIPAGTTLRSGQTRNKGTWYVFGDYIHTGSNTFANGDSMSSTINAVSGTMLIDPFAYGSNDGLRFPDNAGGVQTLNIWDCIITVNAISFGDGTDADKINFAAGRDGALIVRTRTFTDSTNPYYKGTSWNPNNYPNRLVPGEGEAIIVTESGDWTVFTSEVPEPATMLLLGLGGLLLRRKRS